MVLTVTLNPILESRFFTPGFSAGNNYRDCLHQYTAGGKGINVSRQLNKLGVKNVALTFAGGASGRIFKETLEKENINSTIINTKSEIRCGSVIIDEKAASVTNLMGINANISKNEVDEMLKKVEKMISMCEFLVLSGSSPCKETDIIFPLCIEYASKHDKIVILDTYGEHLLECYSKSPLIVHNNFDEIHGILNFDKNNPDSINLFFENMFDKFGIKMVLTTNGSNNFPVRNFGYDYMVELPKVHTIDSTGSGDAFVAGIVYGLYNDLVFTDYLKVATALGAMNASSFEVCNVKPEKAFEYSERVTLVNMGKKLSLIDAIPR